MIWHLLKHGTFAHDLQNGRDRDGRLIACCTLCGWTRLVLGEDVVIGPAHHLKPDLGARLTKAKRVTRDNITPWRRSER